MAERLKAHPGLAQADNLESSAVALNGRCYLDEFLPRQGNTAVDIKVGQAVVAAVFDRDTQLLVRYRRLGVLSIMSDGDKESAVVAALREVNTEEAGALTAALGAEPLSPEFWKGVAPELVRYGEHELPALGLGIGRTQDDGPVLLLHPANS